MRKTIQLITGILTQVVLLLSIKPVFAAELCPPGFESLCQFRLDRGGGANLVGNILSFLLVIAIVLSLIYLVFGGIKYITSGGDKGKVDAAKSHLTAAIVGLIISLMAFFIVNIITYVVTGKGLGGLTIPTLLN